MKKVISVVLVLVFCLMITYGVAESVPQFENLQQAMNLAQPTDLRVNAADHVGMVVKLGDQYYRVTVVFDEKAQKMAAKLAVVTGDDVVELSETFDKYIMSLPVTVEEITAEPKTDEELEAYVGKTLEELQSDHFEWSDGELIGTLSCKPAVWRVICDMFVYDLTLRSSQGKCEAYEIYRGKESLANEVVEQISYVGWSQHAADIAYAADGSEVPQ